MTAAATVAAVVIAGYVCPAAAAAQYARLPTDHRYPTAAAAAGSVLCSATGRPAAAVAFFGVACLWLVWRGDL